MFFGNLESLLFLAITVILAGSVCGIIALVKVSSLRSEVERLNGGKIEPIKPPTFPQHTHVAAKPTAAVRPSSPPKKKKPRETLEMQFGSFWAIWAGAFIFLVGVALGLKYAFDNNLIGPTGRLAIGIVTGMLALGAGEYFRTKQRQVAFQAFCGLGIAIFYLCTYFSFQIYGLTGSGVSTFIAILITLLATFLAVVHNAMSISILALLGGFMSPVMLSSGDNRPWALFSYIAILNLIALFSAYFRRWQTLDKICLAGTFFLYLGWYNKFYTPDQLTVALFFAVFFFLFFVVSPTLYTLRKRIPDNFQSLTILTANSILWLSIFFALLYQTHRYWLGFLLLGQAATLFGLYMIWIRQTQKQTMSTHSLLILTLALVTLVIPVQLRVYSIPIAWGIEGVLFLWLGIRFANPLCRLGGIGALLLSACGLLYNLPLHTIAFTPVFNTAFGSWSLVIVCYAIAVYLINQKLPHQVGYGLLSIIGLAMIFTLLTFETSQFWELYGEGAWQLNQICSLMLLWTVIPSVFSWLIWLFYQKKGTENRAEQSKNAANPPALYFVALATQGIGSFFFLKLTSQYMLNKSELLALNLYFFVGALFLVNLLISSYLLRKDTLKSLAPWGAFIELVAHWGAVLFIYNELYRWSSATTLVSTDMIRGSISATWAILACLLIWIGLVTQAKFRRFSGFALFGLAVFKLILVDTFAFDPVFRIVSWLGIGLMLVIAALLYQRYSAKYVLPHKQEALESNDV